MTTEALTTPPDPQTLEVSLFGSGIGECVMVHLGHGEWMVVDSCRHADTNNPVALQYLKAIGADPAKAVRLIVLSHWHDDHIDGAGEVVSECLSARVCFSGALSHDEFLKLVTVQANPSSVLDREKSGVREMGKILRTLLDRRQGKAPGEYRPHRLTQVDQLLYKAKHALPCDVYALSPSDVSVNQAIQEFAELFLLTSREGRPVLPTPKRNHNAIVLWVRFKEQRALLGSDLEETTDPHTGWTAVLNSELLPDHKAIIFKIPHHGSENAHCEAVWTKMVRDDNPVAILTTYGRGISPLPKPSDIERLKSKTARVYCTTVPRMQPPRRKRAVERTIKEVVKRRQVLTRVTGHIRVRINPTGEPEIILDGAALQF